MEESTYGTFFCITLEERDEILDTDFSANPQLEVQRDIFMDRAIEYVPRKTKEGNPITVRVPLNEKAKFLTDTDRLMRI